MSLRHALPEGPFRYLDEVLIILWTQGKCCLLHETVLDIAVKLTTAAI